MTHKASFMGHFRPIRTRKGGESSRQRLTSAMGGALGTMQFTPDQRAFRDATQGRVAADVEIGAARPLHTMTRHADGTVDVSRMECDGNDWIDLGGHGARDVAAGRA